MTRLPLFFLASLLLLASCTEQPADPGMLTEQPSTTYKTGDQGIDLTDRYIIVFKDGVGNSDKIVDEMTRGNGSKVHFRYQHAIKGFAATIPEQALQGIRHNPNVALVEADAVMTAGAQSSPPSWGLDRIDQRTLPLDALYNYPNLGSGVTVYILDSGIRFDHQEFGSRARSGWDFVDSDADASDCHGHGTHVAGTVGGSTVGVAKNVNLVGVRVLNCTGSGTLSGVVAGIDWVSANHASPAVANMSLGGGYSAALNLAVANSIAAGIVYAVSAGNSNADASTASPASTPTALTVGASTNTDVRASYSNYGSLVDIFAPGSGITSSTMTGTNTYAAWSGTSMASPHVAGVAALYLSANPNATPAQVESALKSSGTANVLTGIGTGSPNLLLYALNSAPQGNPPMAPSALSVASPTTSSLTLTWTDNSTDETGFVIERASGSSGPWTQIATTGAHTATGLMNYVNSGLQSNTAYYYRVCAANSYGHSGYTAVASGTTSASAPPPAAPSGLYISGATNSSLTLTWTDNASDESGFYIERASGSSGPWAQIASVGAHASTGSTTFINSGLQINTTYWYRVIAWNASGNSASSTPASGTTTNTLTAVQIGGVSGFATGNSNSWYATMLVSVRNNLNQPVSGVTVSASWPGGNGSAVTNSQGEASISTARMKKGTNSVTMTVSDVTGPGVSFTMPNPPPTVTIMKP